MIGSDANLVRVLVEPATNQKTGRRYSALFHTELASRRGFEPLYSP